MTVSLLTKPQTAATIAPSSALLVLQPPGHLFAASHLLTPGEYRIGSSSACELVLEADGVAPEHVLLTVNHRGVRLQALDGHTWVNDFLVTHATVRRGDRLSFGPLTFTLRAATADDLLAQLPAQDAQPVESLPSVPSAEPKVIEVIDEALANVEAARDGIEPSALIVESPAPEVTDQAPQPAAFTSQALAAEIAAWQAERASEEEQSRARQTELDTLAAGLEERESRLAAEIAAWEAQRAPEAERSQARQTELSALAATLEERESRLASWETRLVRREEVLDQRHTELDAQRTELDHRESALTAERIRLEQVATTARTELAAEAEKQAAAWADWEATQRRLSAEINSEFAALAEVEATCTTTKARLTEDQQAWAATRAAWQTEHAEWEARRQEQQHQLATWENEAEQSRAEIAQERAQLAEQRADLQAEACQRSASHRELIEARQETQRERRLLAEQQSAWITERETEWIDLRERRRRMDADEREIAELRRQTQELWNEAEAARTTATAEIVATPTSPEIAEPVAIMPVVEIAALPEIASSWDSTAVESPIATVEASFDDVTPPPLPTTLATFEELPSVEEVPPSPWMESRFENLPASEDSFTPNWNADFDARPAVDSFAEADRYEAPPLPAADEFALNHFDNQWPAESSPVAEPSAFDRGYDVHAMSVGNSDVPGVSAYIEPSLSESAAAEPQDSLRAQLAEMFGLPQDFAHTPVHEEEPDNTPEALTPIEPSAADEPIVIEEPVLSIEPSAPEAVEEPEPADDEDAWRLQLVAMLSAKDSTPAPIPIAGAPAKPPSFEARVTPPPVPMPVPSPPAAEEDSISAYMERLLARNKLSSSGAVEAPPVASPTPEVASHNSRPVIDTSVTEFSPTPDIDTEVSAVPLPLPEPRQRVDKDEVRAALQSFREVANLSARTAIAEHGTKTLRGEVTVQGMLAGLAGVAAGAFLLPPLWGGAMQPWPGVGCLIATGWMSWQISQSLHRLKTWHPNDHLEVPNTEEDIPEIDATTSEAASEALVAIETPAVIADSTPVLDDRPQDESP